MNGEKRGVLCENNFVRCNDKKPARELMLEFYQTMQFSTEPV